MSDSPNALPADILAMIPAHCTQLPIMWATIRIMPHRFEKMLLRAMSRAGYQRPEIRQMDQIGGHAGASITVWRTVPEPIAGISIFEESQTLGELLVTWRNRKAGVFEVAWVVNYPQGWAPARMKDNARELVASVLGRETLQGLASILASYGVTKREMLAPPPPGMSLEQKVRADAVWAVLTNAQEQDRRSLNTIEAGNSTLNKEFWNALEAEANAEPRLPPEGPYILAPGEDVSLDRLLMHGPPVGDYSGFATEAETEDLKSGVLPLGRWAFGEEPGAAQLGQSLWISPAELAFEGTLLVAPSGRGKTHLLKRWAEAANLAGYSILIVDIKGDMYEDLRNRLSGEVRYLATDRRVAVGTSNTQERSDRMNLLQGLDWRSALHREDVGALADVLLPSRGWKGEGGVAERAFRLRRALLTNLILLVLMRHTYAKGGLKVPDLGDVYELACDEDSLVEAVNDVQAGEEREKEENPSYPVQTLIREFRKFVAPGPRGATWGARGAQEAYIDYTLGVVDALRPFAPGTTFYEKVRAEGEGKSFDIDALDGPDQVSLILAARNEDGDPSDAMLSFCIKRTEQILSERFKKPGARPVLLLLDETARIRDFDALGFVSIARQANTATVLVYQGIGKIAEAIRQDLLTTIGTQIYLGDVPHAMVPLVQQGLPTRNPTPRSGWDRQGNPMLAHGHDPVPSLGSLELEKLRSGERPGIVYLRDHPSGKPIPVSFYAEMPRTLLSKNYPSLQAAIDDSTPGSTLTIKPGTYQEKLILPHSLIVLAAQPGTVKIKGNLSRHYAPEPFKLHIRSISVDEMALYGPVIVDMADVEVGTITMAGERCRVKLLQSRLGRVRLDLLEGALEIADCEIASLFVNEVQQATLRRTRFSDYAGLERCYEDEQGHPVYFGVDDEDRPAYTMRVEARDCEFATSEVTDAEFRAERCKFAPRQVAIDDTGLSDWQIRAIQIAYMASVEFVACEVTGSLTCSTSSFSARDSDFGLPLIWPGKAAPIDADNDWPVFDVYEFDAPLHCENCRVVLRDLATAKTLEAQVADGQVTLKDCRLEFDHLAPGAVHLDLPGFSVKDDYSSYALEADCEALKRGILPLGHWAFRDTDNGPRRGERLFLPDACVAVLDWRDVTSDLLESWLQTASAEGWSVVVLSDRTAAPSIVPNGRWAFSASCVVAGTKLGEAASCLTKLDVLHRPAGAVAEELHVHRTVELITA